MGKQDRIRDRMKKKMKCKDFFKGKNIFTIVHA